MRSLSVFIAAAFVVVVVPMLLAGFPYYMGVAVYAVVLALFGLSVNLTVGHLGFISFGHAAFLGLGAYTSAMLTMNLGMNYWLTLLFAPIPGALLGILVGFASLRVGGAYFAIATLTTAEILRIFVSNLVDLTRGPMGITVPRPSIPFFEQMGLGFYQYYLGIGLFVLILVTVGLQRLLKSPIGSNWAVIKESIPLAESVGIATLRSRVLNIALSGAIAGLAGGLLVPRTVVVSPDLFSAGLSAIGLLIVILGGKATLIGPILGGVVFSALPEALRFIDDYRMAIFAALLLVVVRLQPDGLVALIPHLRRRSSSVPDAAKPEDLAFQKGDPLEVAGLSIQFGGLKAVDKVRFRIEPGDTIGIIGPNGAGKTTCLSLVSGFLKPSAGEVKLGEKEIVGLAPHELARLGLVRTFQQTAICGRLSVFENVLAAVPHQETVLSSILRGPGYRARENVRFGRALSCLEQVGLADRAGAEAGSLPYGDQKLLSVAVGLAVQPKILLLDEPAAGLNHTEARALAGLLKALRAEGLTIVIVDHNLKMIMEICDRIYVLNRGQPLADGTPEEVRNNPSVIEAYLGTARQKGGAHA